MQVERCALIAAYAFDIFEACESPDNIRDDGPWLSGLMYQVNGIVDFRSHNFVAHFHWFVRVNDTSIKC